MSTANGTTSDHRTVLPRLLDEVVQARAHEQAQARAPQRPGSNTAALNEARQATLQALLRYAEAIEALSWPVPRCIQMDIRMHRIVCAPGSRTR